MATLQQIRQQASRFFGRVQTGTTAASASNTTTTFVDTTLISSLSISDQFTDCYVCLPNSATASDRTARIVSSYTPSTGTITVDRAWSAAPNSTLYELHAAIEPMTGWLAAINDALKRIMVVTEITLTPSTTATRHDLTTTNTWLTNPSWVRQVGYLLSTETRGVVNPYTAGRGLRGWADTDGGTLYLNHPNRTGATGETWYVRVLKPAYFHCKPTSGAFGDQSALALETDEAPVELEFIAWSAVAQAIESHMLDFGLQGDGQLEQKRQHALLMASRYAREWEVAHRNDTDLRFIADGMTFGNPYSGFGGGMRYSR